MIDTVSQLEEIRGEKIKHFHNYSIISSSESSDKNSQIGFRIMVNGPLPVLNISPDREISFPSAYDYKCNWIVICRRLASVRLIGLRMNEKRSGVCKEANWKFQKHILSHE